ncbi:urea ABC transporter [Acetivibrio straminisolvens JCM 21531]|uniref:Urea ABC transporter n=1 Tax=Acetivibrio straminisolvens JCM 21531 TaxID=1294263 RepID=W4VBK9_9FIRM|nr:urea ABC transporter [Acetivibrio straminisolvens JCM 21531]
MSDSILEIKNLTVSFDGFKAVNELSTSVNKGDIHFLSDLTVPERPLCSMQYADVSNRRKEKSFLKA